MCQICEIVEFCSTWGLIFGQRRFSGMSKILQVGGCAATSSPCQPIWAFRNISPSFVKIHDINSDSFSRTFANFPVFWQEFVNYLSIPTIIDEHSWFNSPGRHLRLLLSMDIHIDSKSAVPENPCHSTSFLLPHYILHLIDTAMYATNCEKKILGLKRALQVYHLRSQLL